MFRKLLITIGPLILLGQAWTGSVAAVDLSGLVERIRPSVVTVYTYNKYGIFRGTGSGFFIDDKGTFVTNHHVIKGASSVKIITDNGKEFAVKGLLVDDRSVDLAKARADVPHATLPLNVEAALPAVGEQVVVFGAPQGLSGTVSEGIVSSVRKGRTLGSDKVIDQVQITAPISHGSSGGPVLDKDGNVIGVSTWGVTAGQNLNFAVAAKYILALKTEGKIIPFSPISPKRPHDRGKRPVGKKKNPLTVWRDENGQIHFTRKSKVPPQTLDRADSWLDAQERIVAMLNKRSLSRREIGRSERFVKYANGVIWDTKTGLEWLMGPDLETTWSRSFSWVMGLRKGWRMPTIKELRSLYLEGKERNRSALFSTDACCVWSGKTEGAKAWAFDYDSGVCMDVIRIYFGDIRAFAVRAH